jgi:hypothetical protein
MMANTATSLLYIGDDLSVDALVATPILKDSPLDLTLKEIENKVAGAIDGISRIMDISGHDYIDLDRPVNELMCGLRLNVFNELNSLFVGSFKHLLDMDGFKGFSFEDVYRYSGASFDDVPSCEDFLKWFCVRDCWCSLIKIFNPSKINSKYHECNAQNAAIAFSNITKSSRYVVVKGLWNNNDYGFGVTDEFRSKAQYMGLRAGLLHGGSTLSVLALDKFLESKTKPGDGMVVNGIKLKVFKEHFTLSFEHADFNRIAIYVNKYAKDMLIDVLANKKQYCC